MKHIGIRFVLVSAVTLTLELSATRSEASISLFNDTFNGYTSFPSQIPSGDHVNTGIPEISEGASEFWYGARFQSGGGTIDSDLGVQKVGGGSNQTPVGRFEDDAGLVLRINTTGCQDVTLSFIWRTFLAETSDKFTVGYHVGDDLGFAMSGPNRFRDLTGTWTSNWTQLLSASASDSFHSQTYTLPSNAGPVYVAFWINDGEGDYGKLDNVLITCNPVPEPTTLSLIALAGAALIYRRQRS